MKQAKPILIVKNLTKVYTPFAFPWSKKKEKPFVAVDRVTFNLEEGQILGLLGPNGAGKTTTIQMLLSVLTPSSGSIEFFGQDLATHRSEILSSVSFASTYVKLPWRLSIWENLDVYGRLNGLTANERKERAMRFLKFFGVWEIRDKEVSSLSAGQVTRVMLAKAFLAYPKIALLDEPTASLDPDIAHEVREFVQKQREEYGVSVLYTSHNMDEVTDLCDRVMFLRGGKIVANDTPERLAASISTTKVKLLVGDGMKRTIQYVESVKLAYALDKRSIEITVDEHAIAKLLANLALVGVEYSQISIDKPTLEDYFLLMAKKRKGEK